jgi:hypothetical protein
MFLEISSIFRLKFKWNYILNLRLSNWQLTGRLGEILILWLSVQVKHVYADAINLSWFYIPLQENLFSLSIQARLEIIVGKTPRPGSIEAAEAPVCFEFGRHSRVGMCRK